MDCANSKRTGLFAPPINGFFSLRQDCCGRFCRHGSSEPFIPMLLGPPNGLVDRPYLFWSFGQRHRLMNPHGFGCGLPAAYDPSFLVLHYGTTPLPSSSPGRKPAFLPSSYTCDLSLRSSFSFSSSSSISALRRLRYSSAAPPLEERPAGAIAHFSDRRRDFKDYRCYAAN